MPAKLSSEFLGTFWLVLGGCGSAVIAAAFRDVGIGLLGVSLAFGLTVLSGAYALGPISGGHFNPAVTVGLWAGGRFPASRIVPYVVVQVFGAVAGAGVLYLIASGRADFSLAGGFASNGYAEHSPGGYSLAAGFVSEVVTTFMMCSVACLLRFNFGFESLNSDSGSFTPTTGSWASTTALAARPSTSPHTIARILIRSPSSCLDAGRAPGHHPRS